MAVSPVLETALNNNEKIQAMSDVFKKSSVVVALCLLPIGKKGFWEENVDFLTKSQAKKCCKNCSQWSAHCQT
jgi:hypothetical protein